MYSIPLNKNESVGTGEEEFEGEGEEEEMEGAEEVEGESEWERTDDIIVNGFRKCNGEENFQRQISIINDDPRRTKDSTD